MKYTDSMRLFAKDCLKKTYGLSVTKNKFKEFPLHWHDFFELEIVLSGSGYQILNGSEYEIKKGSIYLLSPVDFHEIKGKEEIEVINIMFDEALLSSEFLHNILKNKSNMIFSLDDNLQEAIFLSELLLREFNENSFLKNKYIYNLLECLLLILLRKINLSNTKSYEITPVLKAAMYIHLHFRENPSLSETAGIAHLNPYYFSQLFHSEMHMSYTEYLTGLKIAYAKKLLLTKQFSVTEVCFESGFSSLSNFLRTFKKSCGQTPTEYIKKHNAFS